MNMPGQVEYAAQSVLLRAWLHRLREQGRRVRLLETHISWVVLVGRYAYKLKKAVNLGFLDFSGLELRRYYCAEEIRLNRRLAAGIYLEVVGIGGSIENPQLHGLPVLEYAVKMRRFVVGQQFDRLLLRKVLLPQHIDSLAGKIASFHLALGAGLPEVAGEARYGTAQAVYKDVAQNFTQLQGMPLKRGDSALLAALRSASDAEFQACSAFIEQRREQGFVRECHGDMHLANIVLLDGQATPFDGIEFNPALRWIDVINELAFPFMDLLLHKRADLAYRLLNAYLEVTGDYAGLGLLRFYLAYRAMVRAKVSAIRATQPELSPRQASREWANYRSCLALAASSFARARPVLIITYGLPGSGKTTFSQLALQKIMAIRLRSDVERKRLYGVATQANSRAQTGLDLYTAAVTQQTYVRLAELARPLLQAGYSVVVDAAFASQQQRDVFYRLAHELDIACLIASIQSSPATLRTRITQRMQAGADASEADVVVLEKLQLTQQPLSVEENARSVIFDNEHAGIAGDSPAWNKLEALVASSVVAR